MTDERLTELFAEGTAPERDLAFARRVDSEISRARLGRRVVAIVARALVGLALGSVVFMTARMIEPVLAPIAENSPKVMGVPLPLVLGVFAVGVFVVCARRVVRLRLG